MILLIDPGRSSLRWHVIREKVCTGGMCELVPESCQQLAAAVHPVEVETVAYFLYHGGGVISEKVSHLRPESLPLLRRTIEFMPERNAVTLQLIEQGMDSFPEAEHLLLCDTAFFASLPPQASTYAIPHRLRQKGLRRYGGYGLCHQWVWDKVQEEAEQPVERLVSIYLGDVTNLAAIDRGEPRETSIGFTSVEGMPSATSCGDIDPTIPLHLRSSGMEFSEISELLSRESGFTGLLGRRCGLRDILEGEEEDVVAVRETFRHNLIRQIGAFIAVLGGIDAIAFISDDPDRYAEFIENIKNHIGSIEVGGEALSPTPTGEGTVHAHSLLYNKEKIAADLIGRYLERGDRQDDE
jgi:acetate kinase